MEAEGRGATQDPGRNLRDYKLGHFIAHLKGQGTPHLPLLGRHRGQQPAAGAQLDAVAGQAPPRRVLERQFHQPPHLGKAHVHVGPGNLFRALARQGHRKSVSPGNGWRRGEFLGKGPAHHTAGARLQCGDAKRQNAVILKSLRQGEK
jgi:hypothetical protein